MSEQQVLNYLLWLRDRGQYFFVPTAPVTQVGGAVETDVATEVATAPAPISAPLPAAKAAVIPTQKPEPVHPLKVLFVSLHPLDAAEDEMVSRIANALSLKSQDFKMVAGEAVRPSLDSHHSAHVVVMGDDAKALIDGTQNPALMISHPGAMLREPTLKVSAWATLQRLKSLV